MNGPPPAPSNFARAGAGPTPGQPSSGWTADGIPAGSVPPEVRPPGKRCLLTTLKVLAWFGLISTVVNFFARSERIVAGLLLLAGPALVIYFGYMRPRLTWGLSDSGLKQLDKSFRAALLHGASYTAVIAMVVEVIIVLMAALLLYWVVPDSVWELLQDAAKSAPGENDPEGQQESGAMYYASTAVARAMSAALNPRGSWAVKLAQAAHSQLTPAGSEQASAARSLAASDSSDGLHIEWTFWLVVGVIVGAAFMAFVVAAGTEEAAKLHAVRGRCLRRKEPMPEFCVPGDKQVVPPDVLALQPYPRLYGPTAAMFVAVALGFATVENFGYLSGEKNPSVGMATLFALTRLVLSLPTHVVSALLTAVNLWEWDARRAAQAQRAVGMGGSTGVLAVPDPFPMWRNLVRAVALHGTFDFVLMVSTPFLLGASEVTALAVQLPLALAVLGGGIWYLRRRMAAVRAQLDGGSPLAVTYPVPGVRHWSKHAQHSAAAASPQMHAASAVPTVVQVHGTDPTSGVEMPARFAGSSAQGLGLAHSQPDDSSDHGGDHGSGYDQGLLVEPGEVPTKPAA